MKSYDNTFFDYVNSGATESAERILPLLLNCLEVGSVLDVGCGQGAWLAVWSHLGVADCVGVDGQYVDTTRLQVPRDRFVAHDLTSKLDLDRRFDIVQSLEVAEHLDARYADAFVEGLVRHGDVVLFSAAPRGQGGDHHVNEQDYDYWRSRFARHGYVAIDYLRPKILKDTGIEPWYRYNILIYASLAAFDAMPAALRDCRIPDGARVPDLSPPLYRARKAMTALLPVVVSTYMAKVKERAMVTLRRRRHGSKS